ncbi:MAG: gliding motility lipoprotein GldB [Flavobacteriaceae bacterium]|nr:gliding motility lipoprotein GldB [Flavobacteriaceae bacterium]
MRQIILFMSVILCLCCDAEDKLEKNIAAIPMDVNVERFDRLFANADQTDFKELKKNYPFLFSKQYHDSVWVLRMQDSMQIELHKEVAKIFPNFDKQTQEITAFYQHLKYYYPTFKKGRLITVIPGDVNYRNKVVVTDTINLIALDTYLGVNHKFYENFYDYIKQNMTASQILPDLATEYAKKYSYQSKRKTFLDELVYFGKQLYFMDVMLPNYSDADKIGYSPEQLQWAAENEQYIWRHFVENEMLFDTNPKLIARFINPAPFSKFNLELDRDSPGRLGRYIGWQIVRAYMEKNNVSFKELMQKEADDIFNNSNFKPKK